MFRVQSAESDMGSAFLLPTDVDRCRLQGIPKKPPIVEHIPLSQYLLRKNSKFHQFSGVFPRNLVCDERTPLGPRFIESPFTRAGELKVCPSAQNRQCTRTRGESRPMPGNTFGHLFRVTTFGESHGPAVGCVIDGCPPDIPIDFEQIQQALDRRRPGQSKLVTPRNEADRVECLSGISMDNGHSLGTPIALMVRNADQRSKSYEDWHHIYRPSHADYTYDAKYGIRAWQGGGRSSARETTARVAAGALAEQVLRTRFPNLRVVAWVEQVHVHNAGPDIDADRISREDVDQSATRVPNADWAEKIEAAILAAKGKGDSLGGIVRLYIPGFHRGSVIPFLINSTRFWPKPWSVFRR